MGSGLRYCDSIDWTTADPVTGTVGKFSYSSEGSATNTENFEPLGQRLHPHDSEDYEPPVNESFVGSADDAEWQCKASAQFWGGESGNFSDLPWHCQKRMLQDIATPLKDTFGWGGKKESPANVSILIRRNIPRGPHDAGPDNGWTYAANSMRAEALTSTAKDDDDDPESKGNKKQRRFTVTFKIPQFDKPPIDMSDTEWLDASQSDDDHLTDSQLKKIREDIPKALTDKCADYINQIMREHTGNKDFDAKKDLLKAFDYIQQQAPEFGFKWGSGNGAGKKEITLARPQRASSGKMYGLNIMSVVHELIHVAGLLGGRLSSDEDISETVNRLGIKVYKDNGEIMKPGADPNHPNDIGYRWYWAQGLKNNCPEYYDSEIY